MSAIRNSNDGSGRPPRLRLELSLGTIDGVPDWSTAPRGSRDEVFAAIRAAGFESIQGGTDEVEAARRANLRITTGGRVDKPGDAADLARLMKESGLDLCTLHVGTGFEDDDEADRLMDAIIDASVKHDYPLYVETHRATLTQDCWRTLKLIERHPGIRLNGDFSHWYTGLEMVYGDWPKKLTKLKPAFDRVRFIHGRIGNPGSMQVDIGDGSVESRPFVQHFRELWTQSFIGFLKSAGPGDYICFTPELLHPRIYYARVFNGQEECDRWQQALVYCRIAQECFDEAARQCALGRK